MITAIPHFYQSSSMLPPQCFLLNASGLVAGSITIPTSIQHLAYPTEYRTDIFYCPNSAPHCACSHLADAIDESYHADGLGHKVPYDGIRLPYNWHALLALGSVTRCLMMGSGCLVTRMPNKAQMTFRHIAGLSIKYIFTLQLCRVSLSAWASAEPTVDNTCLDILFWFQVQVHSNSARA